MVRSYKAIVGSTYCIVINVIIPVIFIMIGSIVDRIHYDTGFMSAAFAIACLAEVGCEYFGMGPIYKKHCMGMEYMKTAYLGMDRLKQTINTDSIFRCIRIAAYVIIPSMVNYTPGTCIRILTTAFLLAAASVWSVNLTRYVTIFSFMFLAEIPILVPAMALHTVLISLPQYAVYVMVISIILLTAGLIFTDRMAGRKIAASYKD